MFKRIIPCHYCYREYDATFEKVIAHVCNLHGLLPIPIYECPYCGASSKREDVSGFYSKELKCLNES